MNKEERDKLIEDNLGLVYHVVNKYFSKYGDRDEFISVGSIGLIKAANAYDENSNLKFSTFAYKCIYNEISRFLNVQNYDVRKANLNNFYLDSAICDDSELTFKDELISNESYSDVYCKDIMNLVRTSGVKDAEYVVLKRYEGYTFEEIGKSLGVTKDAIRSRISGIRRRLIRAGITA